MGLFSQSLFRGHLPDRFRPRPKPRRRDRFRSRRTWAPVAAEVLEDRTLLATIVWDGGGGNNAWNNAANWFDETNGVDNVLPGSGDDVEIRAEFADETIQFVNTATVNSLQTAANLQIQNGTLNLLNASRFDGAVHLVSGGLANDGQLTVTNLLTWTGGSLAGAGTVFIAPEATFSIASAGSAFILGDRTLENEGTIEWIQGGVNVSDALTINNRVGGVFDVQNGASLSGSGGVLNNEGLLRKSSGSGRSQMNVVVHNSGLVEVESGTLALLRGGNSSGSFSIDADATLELRALFTNPHTITLADTESIAGEGRLLVTDHVVTIQGEGTLDVGRIEISTAHGANLNLNLDSEVPIVVISNGALTGTGTLTATESLLWFGGEMGGGGTTRIAEGATLTLDASGVGMAGGGRIIENFGTFEWIRGNINASSSSRLTVVNREGALFNIQTSEAAGNIGSVFHNDGTVRKSAGAGRSDVRMTFNNTGTVEVLAGTLALSRGGTSSGEFLFDAGTTLELRGGDPPPFSGQPAVPHLITLAESDRIAGQGRLLVSHELVTIQGNGTIDVSFLEVNGTAFVDLELDHDAVIPQVVLGSGELIGTGTLTVTDTMDWTGGDMGGLGTTRIAAGATLTLDAVGVGMSNGGRTIENFGTFEWLRGNINASSSTPLIINNQAGGLLEILNNEAAGNVGSVLNNAGTIRKSAGIGRSDVRMTVNSTGTVEVQSGTLALSRGGTSDGDFLIDAGATLELRGGDPPPFSGLPAVPHLITLSAPNQMVGEGRLHLSHELITLQGEGLIDVGTLEVSNSAFVNAQLNQDVTARHVVLAAGVLGGTGTLTVEESMTWTGGRMENGGTTVISPEATLTINPGVNSTVTFSSGRVLDNFGTVQWLTGSINSAPTNVFNNHEGALFDIRSDRLYGGTAQDGRLNNAGTIRKSAGTGTSTVQLVLDNQGTVEARTGTLAIGTGLVNWLPAQSTLAGGTWLADSATLRLNGLTAVQTLQADVLLEGEAAAFVNGSNADLLRELHRIDPGGSLALRDGRDLLLDTAAFLDNRGELEIGAGSTLSIDGIYTQTADARLTVELAGEPASGDFGRIDAASVDLAGTLTVELAEGFTPTAGEAYTVMAFASRNGEFDDIEGLSVGGVQFLDVLESPTSVVVSAVSPGVEWDLGPVGIVRAGAVRFLDEPGPDGEIAELLDLKVELLPDSEDGLLATITIDRALAFDDNGGPLSLDSFHIEEASLFLDELLVGPDGARIFALDDLQIRVSDFSNRFGILAGQILVSAGSATLLPGSSVTAQISDDDPLDDQPGLHGALDLATGQFELVADRLTAEIGELFDVDVDDGTLRLAPDLAGDDPVFTAASATITVPLLGDADVALTAADLRFEADGDVSITSAEALAGQGLAASLGLAGILPLDLTRVAIAGLDADADGQLDPISLRSFSSDVTVEGFFDFSAFDEIGFRPTVSIGGVLQPEGAGNDFALTFRLVNGAIVPWNVGPIAVALTAAEVFPGFQLSGNLTLGGFQNGVWAPDLTGSLTARLDVDGTVHTGLTVNVLPGSTLDITTGILSLSGEVLLDAGLEAEFGEFSLAGGRLPFQMLLDVDPIAAAPFFKVATFEVTFGEISLDQLVIELAGVFTLTASEIALNSGAGPDDPVATIGRLEIDVPALAGLQAQAVVGEGGAHPGITLYRDRLELDGVELSLSGVLNTDGVDLLLVENLFVAFESVVIPFTGISDLFSQPNSTITLTDLSDLTDPNSPLPQLAGISFGVDAAVLLPESSAVVPTVQFDTEGNLVGELDPEVDGVAVIAGVLGTIGPDGTLRLDVGHMSAGIADLFDVVVEDARIVLPGAGATVSEPLFYVGSASLALTLLDDQQIQLTATDLTIEANGNVSITSAGAAPVPPAVGIGEALGLADILPFDISLISLDNDGAPVLLNDPEFDLLVEGFFNFDLFDGLPFEPFVQIGEGDFATIFDDPQSTVELTFRVDATPPPGVPPISIANAGPFFLGFKELSFGELTLDGLIAFGAFIDGRFDGTLGGAVRVRGGDPDVDPDFLDVQLAVLGQVTQEEIAPGTFVTTFDVDFTGSGTGKVGGLVEVENAQFDVNMAFQNTSTPEQPFLLEPVARPGEEPPFPVFRFNVLDTGLVSIHLGDYVTISGQAEINFAAGPDEPVFIVRSGDLHLGEELGPLANFGGSAGGFGIGSDGRIYVLADDPATPQNEGARIELSAPVGAGVFGLPDWLPLTINTLGLRFNGVDANGDGAADDLNGDGLPDDYDISLGGGFSQFAPLVDPNNFSLLISGGLQSAPDGWPIQAQVERLAVDLGILANNIEAALQHFGLFEDDGTGQQVPQYDQLQPWQIFTAPTGQFPITNLEAIDFGVEPFDIGPVGIGGGIGFGQLTVERPIDPDDPDSAVTEEKVFFARVEGEIAGAEIGLGAELIITQYGPVVARIFAGVPIPVGTLIGMLGGPIGAGIGTGTGFLITGLQGGIVFGGDPLPVVEEPTDIFSTPELAFPLDVQGLEAIREVVTPLVLENPSFSELMAAVTAAPGAIGDLSYQDVIGAILAGGIPDPRNPGETLQLHFTWEDGFRLAASGVLTNQYVTAMIGAGLTLGANFGFDLDQLRYVNGSPLVAADGTPLDSSGNPIVDAVTETVLSAADAFGVQLFGIADLDIMGQKLVSAGVLLDYSDVLNPKFNIAASLPGRPGSLLSLLLPASGNIGLQLDSTGLNEGSLVAAIAFFSRLAQPLSGAAGTLFDATLERLAAELEASRRTALELSLDGLAFPEGFTPKTDDPLWRILLDLDGDHTVSEDEQQSITGSFLMARLFGNGMPALLPALDSLDFASFAEPIDPLAELRFDSFDNTRLTDLVMLGTRLFSDFSRSAMGALSDPGFLDPATLDAGPLFAGIEASINAGYAALSQGVPPAVAQTLDAARIAALNSARVTLAIQQLIIEAGGDALEKFFDTIDPKLRIVGRLQPMIFGIPFGEPKEEISVTVSKNLLSIQGKVGLIEKLLALSPIPVPITSEEFVDIQFPFDNLLLDLATAQFPQIDPLGGDWRVGLGSAVGMFGLEVAQARGYLFPPEAVELLLTGRLEDGILVDEPILQVYDPNLPPEELDPDRILVHTQFVDRLLEEGGVLVDGRLILPRFITDPLALFSELEQGLHDIIHDDETGEAICEDILSCILANPAAVFEFLVGLPDRIGSLREVAQLQLFVPNFMDDVIAGLGDGVLDDLIDAATASGDQSALIDVILQEAQDQFETVRDIIRDPENGFYIYGSYGQLPEPYGQQYASVELPTTSKLLGIEMGGAQITGDATHLEIVGTFLGLANVAFQIDTRDQLGIVVPRVKAELEFGPDVGATHAPDQFAELLRAIGLDPDDLSWLALPSGTSLEGLLRAYSPGFQLPGTGVDDMQVTGGIEAHAQLVLPGFVDNAAFDFRITPSTTLVPNIDATAVIEDFTLGLPPELFNADLQLSFSTSDGTGAGTSVAADIAGSVQLVGQQHAVAGQLTLDAAEGIYGFLDVTASGGLTQFNFEDTLSFEGHVTLLVNATGSARTFDLPNLSPDEDPVLQAFGSSLLLDGRVTIAGTTLDGVFQLRSDAGGFSLLGSAEATFNAFHPLFVGSTEVTVSAELQTGADGLFGAALLAAVQGTGFGGTSFTSQSTTVGLAFNTDTTVHQVSLPAIPGHSFNVPGPLSTYLDVPAQTFRLFTSGELSFLQLGLSGDLMAQASLSTQSVDIAAVGDFDLGPLGEVDASGFLRLGATSMAGQFDVNGKLQLPGVVELEGETVFEFNTGTTTVAVPLAGTTIAAGPQARLEIGTSIKPATLTLLRDPETGEARVQLTGDAELFLSPNAFTLDAELQLRVDIPAGVPLPPGFPDPLVIATADVALEVANNVLQRAEFDFFVSGFGGVKGELERSGCFMLSIPGLPPLHFDVLHGLPWCEPYLFVDDVSLIEGDGIGFIPVTISPVSNKPVTFKFTFLDGTAIRGEDYDAGSVAPGSTVTVAPGQRTVNIPIALLNNQAEDGDRTFTLRIDSSISGAKAGDRFATVTILDDDQPPIGPPVTVRVETLGNLSLEAISLKTLLTATGENEGPARLRLSAPELLDGDTVTIGWSLVPRDPSVTTATLSDDFTLGTGTVELQGATPRQITLPVLNDAVLEFAEEFEIVFQIVEPARFAPSTTLAIDNVVVTIENDDPERPAGSLAFYNFDGKFVPGQPGDYGYTRASAFVLPDVLVSAVTHSAGTPSAGGGLPKLDPALAFDPETPAAAATSWTGESHLSANLVQNPGNETSGFAGWKFEGEVWRNRPLGAVSPIEGTNYFVGGLVVSSGAKGTTRLSQEVDVSSFAASIDTGLQEFDFEALVRAKTGTGDRGQIVLEYLNGKGGVLDRFTSGTVTTSTVWETVENREAVPVGTRRIRITLIGQNGNQSTGAVDVYFDAVNLRAVMPQFYSLNLTLDDDPNPVLETLQDFQNAKALTVTGLDFWEQSSSTGPVHWELRSNADGFLTALASGSTSPDEFGHHVRIAVEGLEGLRPVEQPLELRLYAWSAGNGAWRVDNLAVLGEVQSLSEFEQAPIANDDTATTLNTNFTIIDVDQNDFDPNLDVLSFSGFSQPEEGFVEKIPGATNNSFLFRYTPNGVFSGTDTFTYTITDGKGNHDTATVSVNVLAPPDPVADTYAVVRNTTLTVNAAHGVVANDSLGSVSNVTVVRVPTTVPGTLNLNANGSFTYTPPANFTGEVQFRYVLNFGQFNSAEATVRITVVASANRQANNDSFTVAEDNVLSVPGPGVLGNDLAGLGTLSAVLVTGVQHGDLTLDANGSFEYVPDANYHGSDSFQYRIGTSLSDPLATVSLLVTPKNDLPVAQGRTISVLQGTKTEIIISVSGTDLETPANQLQPVIFGLPTHASGIYVGTDNTIRYVPHPINGFQQSDSFQFNFKDTGDPHPNLANDAFSPPVTVTLLLFQSQVQVTRTIGSGFNGYLAESTVFFDANGSLVPDSVELIDPETGALAVFDEPVTTTAADGSFNLDIPLAFDLNGNGQLDPEEGTLILNGGLVTNTGQSLPTRLGAPGGASVVTPLTTLLWQMAGAFGVADADGQTAVRTAFNLPDVDLLHFHALNEVHQGNPLAPSVYRTSVALQTTAVQLGAVLSAATGVNSTEAVDAVLLEIAERALVGQVLDLSDTATIRTMLDRLAGQLGATLDEETLDAIAEIVSATNHAFRQVSPSADIQFLEDLASIEQVAQGPMLADLLDLVSGTLSPQSAVEQNTGDALSQQIAAATVGNLTPVQLSVADQIVDVNDGVSMVEFIVRLDQASAFPVRVTYTTADGTAVAGEDYAAVSGELEFAPGELEQTVQVPLIPGQSPGLTRFDLVLGDADGAVLIDALATAYLVVGGDNDNVPALDELAAPHNGDGNQDGVLDALQSHVASLRNAVDRQFITVVASGDVFAEAVEVEPDALDSAEFLLGALQYAGAGDTVTLHFEQPVAINSYYRFGPTAQNPEDHWHPYLFNGQTGAELIDADNDGLIEQIVLHLANWSNGLAALSSGTTSFLGAPVFNPPPEISDTSGPPAGVTAQELTFSATFTDTGSESHTVTIHWGDGTSSSGVIDEASGTVTGNHAYAAPGDYEVRFEMSDAGGNVVTAEAQVSITRLRLVDDSQNPGRQILFVGGTPGRDHIEFKARNRGQTIEVRLNRRTIGRFDADSLSRLVAFGGDGSDHIHVDRRIEIPAELHGGSGRDHLHGGKGPTTVYGGPGSDRIRTGSGNDYIDAGSGNDSVRSGRGHDILLGGDGRDHLVGQHGHDLIIGGAGFDRIPHRWSQDLVIPSSTDIENDRAALESLLVEWIAEHTQPGNAKSHRSNFRTTHSALERRAASQSDNCRETLLEDILRDRLFATSFNSLLDD